MAIAEETGKRRESGDVMQLGLIGQYILLDTGHERERRGKQVSGCGNRVDFHI